MLGSFVGSQDHIGSYQSYHLAFFFFFFFFFLSGVHWGHLGKSGKIIHGPPKGPKPTSPNELKAQIYPSLNIKSQKNVYYLSLKFSKTKPKYFRNTKLQHLCPTPPQSSIKNPAHFSPLNDEPSLPLSFLKFNVLKNKI